MKKWRNLRDTFKRQIETEKKIREGHNIKKKTYVYFRHMLYLLPHMSTSGDAASDPVVEPKLNEYFKRSTKRTSSDKQQDRKFKRKKRLEKHMPIKSVTIPEMPSRSTDIENLIDEDKHFLMSLVPSLKRMNDDEKLEAKLKILKVIKGIRKNKNNVDSVEYNSVTESLSYNLDDIVYNDVKMEIVSDDRDECESQSSTSDSDDTDNDSGTINN